MNKKIICILVSMLMCATAAAVTGFEISDENQEPQLYSVNPMQNRDMWDVQFQFDAGGLTGSLYMVGVGFDGEYFYCPTFNSATVYRFGKDGSYIDSFTMPGVPNLIDLAYDGTYFYGTSTTGTILYEMDLVAHSVISQVNLPAASYNVAYDADADGGNGGFWIGQWQNHLTLVSRSGATLDTISPVPDSMLGFAWDPWTNIEGYNGPFLWVFTGTSTGGQGVIKVIDLDTKTLIPSVQHNVATELGMGIAGGLEFTTDYAAGTGTLYGLVQGAGPPEDYVFGYEICVTNAPPLTPGAPSGPDQGVTGVEYTFTATTTDPEGDPIEYWFDFGDGENSDWVSPGSAKHIWATAGTYNVTVKARDAVHGGESAFSPPHEIEILGGPVLKVKKR
jgi:hypothetical protein